MDELCTKVEDVGIQRLCLLLLLIAEAVGQEDNCGRGTESDDDEYLLEWLLNFFFSPSVTLSSDLTCRTFVSFKPAGRTQLQRKPTDYERRILYKWHIAQRQTFQRCKLGRPAILLSCYGNQKYNKQINEVD